MLVDARNWRREIPESSLVFMAVLPIFMSQCGRVLRPWLGRIALFGFLRVTYWQLFDLIWYHSLQSKLCPPCDRSEDTPMWEDSRYFWVVHCKNHWFHVRKNLFFRHRIPLAETDAVTPRPAIDCRFRARCDQCGKEYLYKPSEV